MEPPKDDTLETIIAAYKPFIFFFYIAYSKNQKLQELYRYQFGQTEKMRKIYINEFSGKPETWKLFEASRDSFQRLIGALCYDRIDRLIMRKEYENGTSFNLKVIQNLKKPTGTIYLPEFSIFNVLFEIHGNNKEKCMAELKYQMGDKITVTSYGFYMRRDKVHILIMFLLSDGWHTYQHEDFINACASCDKPNVNNSLLECGNNCGSHYCGVKCQTSDWDNHREKCDK